MPRYIDAEELWLQLDKRESFEQGRNRAYYKGLRDAKKVLEDAPTADVVERKEGKWMAQKGGGYRCSECKHYALDERDGNLIHVSAKTKFCPHCGADMREEKTNED